MDRGGPPSPTKTWTWLFLGFASAPSPALSSDLVKTPHCCRYFIGKFCFQTVLNRLQRKWVKAILFFLSHEAISHAAWKNSFYLKGELCRATSFLSSQLHSENSHSSLLAQCCVPPSLLVAPLGPPPLCDTPSQLQEQVIKVIISGKMPQPCFKPLP